MRKRYLPKLKFQAVLLIIVLLCLFAHVGNVYAVKTSVKVVQNEILAGNLVMQFQAEEVFTEKVIKFLNRGFTVRVEYKIELWRSRRYWFDRLDSQHNINYQIDFRPLEKRYMCVRSQQEPAVTSKLDQQLDEIILWATRPEPPLTVIPMERLDPEAEYYYNIEILVATLTAQNIKDLQKWLGEFGAEEEEPSTLTKTSFKVARDFLSSKNNRKVSARSEKFHLYDLPKLDK